MDDDSRENRQTSFYYGWVIIALAFITLAVIYGIWYSYSVFILAVIEEFNWSRATASSIFSVFVLTHSFAGLAAGPLLDRFGPRLVIPVGAAFLGGSLFLTSLAQNLWQYQLAFGLMAGISMSLIAFNLHSAFIPRWFERKRGMAVGIAMSGIGLGMLFIVPLTERLIAYHGWRTAYVVLAAIVVFIVGPVNLIFSRRSPESINLKPDGESSFPEATKRQPKRVMRVMDQKWAGTNWSVKQAIRTKRFWFLAGSYFSISYANQGILLHSVSSMVDAGIDRIAAASFFGIVGISSSSGKILFGFLSDRMGRERAKTLADSLAVLGVLSLMSVAYIGIPMPIFFGIFFGLGCGAAAALIPTYCADVFLGAKFGTIFTLIAIGGGIGGSLGTWSNGFLHDITGSYVLPFLVCCGAIAGSNILVWFAAPSKIRRLVKF